SKGPLVAWLIRGSTELFGQSVTAVRLPALVCHALMLLAVRRLARQLLDERFALGILLCALTWPSVSAGAVLMTIDAPLLAAWAWALVFVYEATSGQRQRPVLIGTCILLGILAKYSMLLFPASWGLYLVLQRAPRHQWRTWGLACIIGALALLPILEWNLRNEGLGGRHLAERLQARQSAPGLFGILDALGGQLALTTGYWFLVLVYALAYRTPHPTRRFLVVFTVPVFLALFSLSLMGKTQPNWSLPGYLSGLILVGFWLREELDGPQSPWRRLVQICFGLGFLLGALISTAAHFPLLIRRPLAEVTPQVRSLDPTARLVGWEHLAQQVDGVRARVRAEGNPDPHILTMVWSWAGEIAFYSSQNPQVSAIGAILTDRQSQYDIWRPNFISDAQFFRGATCIYVGEIGPSLIAAFETIEPPL
ncbi:MAG: ArnT family glycosyltransferase, partial [Gemmataceae bacterium]